MYRKPRQPRPFTLTVIAMVLFALAVSVTTIAQDATNDKPEPPAKARRSAAGPPDMQLTGTLLDARTFTQIIDRSTWDADRVAKNLDAGVPAVIAAGSRNFVIGCGEAIASKELVAMAMTTVQVQGKLYRRAGIQYLEISSIEPAPKIVKTLKPPKPKEEPTPEVEPEEEEQGTVEEVPAE